MSLISKISNLSNLDIGEKSLIFSQRLNFNCLIFLLISMNDISDIFESKIYKISNFSNLDIGVKFTINPQSFKYNSLIFLLFSKNDI